jgi:hypothetical protein
MAFVEHNSCQLAIDGQSFKHMQGMGQLLDGYNQHSLQGHKLTGRQHLVGEQGAWDRVLVTPILDLIAQSTQR